VQPISLEFTAKPLTDGVQTERQVIVLTIRPVMKNTRLTTLLVWLLFSNAAPCLDSNTGDPVRTGEFSLSFTIAEAADADSARAVDSIISADEKISWEVYVPESYQAENPAGLVVYISPSSSGDIPPRWKSVMNKLNMIWIAAGHSGNRVMVARRVAYALIAPTLAGKYYNIDHERIYLSGFSGGGRVASMLAASYPQVFKGGIYNCGANFWDENPPTQLGLVKQNHYVFLTGTKDQALRPTKKVHQQYLQSGVDNSRLMVIRHMAHENPNGSDFEKAIRYLDSRITP